MLLELFGIAVLVSINNATSLLMKSELTNYSTNIAPTAATITWRLLHFHCEHINLPHTLLLHVPLQAPDVTSIGLQL